ncbi:hypothetical protein F66182_5501 [Fusarium sp. NRRL 66182]|nr:hypothetical protein F66182_5501 [Fusarium sp. NRRL 66182]
MPEESPQATGETTPDQSQPSKRRNTKSFTGCWTCRAKHVKCDEAKPTCNRCQRAGIECEGYGMRIAWANVRNPSTFKRGTTKRAYTRRAHHGQTTTLGQPNLDSADDDMSALDTPPAAENRHPTDPSIRPREPSSETPSIASPYTQSHQPALSQDPFIDHLNTRIFHSYELLGQGLTTAIPFVPLQPEQPQLPVFLGPNPAAQDTISHNHDASTPVSIGDIGNGSMDVPGVSQPASQASTPVNTRSHAPKKRRHLDVLPNPRLQCELLEHWTLRLCDSLAPVPGIHNPLRNVMTPIALEGGRTDSEQSTGATALFHLICSASAFHLAKKRGTPESRRTLENVALEHHNIGITHLAQNIRRSNDGAHCVSLLASLVMCLMNEAVTLPTTFWRAHFRGAVEWVNHIDPQVWHQNEAASTVYQMFRGLATVVQAQLLFDSRETSHWEFTNDLEPQPEPYVLYLAFGLPQPILQGIHAMNALELRRKASPDNPPTADELDRLELELYLSAPDKPDASESKDHADLIYHHGRAFHYAALIHMKRTMKDISVAQVQPLVEKALPHIEALPSDTSFRCAPMVWPIAMVALETGDVSMQHRMLQCLQNLEQCSELALWSQITHHVKELWALRTREGADLKWHQTALGSMSDGFMLM